jgi:pimeloyl-ACP methyl ester carboxylesterase
MTEQFAQANGITLCYETFGDPANPPLLAVMGLGAQMIGWDAAFLERFASRGFFVIRFDNRDTGRSTILADRPTPDLQAIVRGDRSTVPYILDDMADDAVALLDALGIARAHVMGASMGGMIVQAMAIRHPDRLLSLASIMSTTGDRSVGQPTKAALDALMVPPAQDREGHIARAIASRTVIGSPGFPMDEERIRRVAGDSFDRGFYPAGVQRQYAAIVASGDRTAGLREVRVPAVVIHGADDPLVTLSGGEATAAAIPGARLVVVPGMGHDLPAGAWDQIVDAVVENAARAAQPAR